jgi:nitrogen-specific signal transduction histidine kinase/CheY-like chemotaxis protein
VWSFRDVTEHKLLEERLRQSEKMDAIGQLAGGVAHDFNNQLGGIMNYADLLLSKTDDEELRPFIDGIIRLCTRSGKLTNQLLAFSRKGQYQVVPVSIHRVAGEVVSMLGHSIDRRIQIRQRLDANPPTTTGDPTQLQNALLNLGLNARDAMPEGGELVFATDTVALDEEHCRNSSFELMPGEYVRIKVTDSGAGMDEETRSKIFEPFFTTKEQGKGTGMGLAAVFGTVVNHRGAIEVESEIGRGTTMTVYLPLSREEPREAEAGGRVAAQAATESAGAGILVVDDEEVVRECTARMLRRKGYRVATCKDGAEAVDYYRKSWQHIDLVILDMNMPVMNGHDAFIAMRGINAGIRAMLATGYSLDDNAQKILDEGALSYLQKPFRIDELVVQIERALGG